MKTLKVVLATLVGLLMGFALSRAQVYEFSKPNVPVNDDSLGRHQHYPTSAGMHNLVVKGDTVYSTWYDNRDSNFKIYFSKSSDEGNSWTRNVIINDTATATHGEPALAFDKSGRIFVSWCDDRRILGKSQVYCAKSTDGGLSWGQNVLVSVPTFIEKVSTQSICIDRNERILIAWMGWEFSSSENRAYFSKSTDGGNSFGPTYRLTPPGYFLPDYTPSIGVDDSGLVYAAFSALGPGSTAPWIWFTKAVDSGDTSFIPPKIVSDTMDFRNNPSLVTKSNGNTYIAYQSVNVPWVDIYLVKSTDRGRTFGSQVRVNDIRPSARYPSIAVDESNGVYVAWRDDRSGSDHGYFAASTNGGDSFGPSVLIEDTSGSPNASRYWQNLAVDPQTGTAYVIWSDERNNPGAAMDIYSARGVLRSGVEERVERLAALNEVRLEAIYPNPMREKTSIRYALSKKGDFCLTVYNVAGQRVCTLREGVIDEGVHDVRWDGRDANGKEVKAGVYFIGLEWDGHDEPGCRLVRQLVKLK